MLARLKHICEQESIEAEDSALELVARQATGSLRDALSLLDQLRVYAEKAITLKTVQDMLGAGGSEEVAAFVDAIIAADMADGLRRISMVSEEGRELRQFNRQVVEHLRDLLLVKSGAAAAEGVMLDVTDEMRGRLRTQAEGVGIPELLRWIKTFGDADTSLRSTIYGQLPLEMALVEAILRPEESAQRPEPRARTEEIAAAVEQIGVVPSRQRPPPASQTRPAQPAPQPLPPPIHTEFAAMSGNGKHAADEVRPTPDSPEPVAEALPTIEASQEEPEQATLADAPSPPTGDTSGDLARLVGLWSDVADQINARSKAMAAVFRNTEMVRPISLDNGVCLLGFRDRNYATTYVTNHPHPRRDVIESALARVLGYKVTIESITFEQLASGKTPGDEDPSPRPSARNATREKPSPYETTRGKAAMNIFGIEKFEEN
jgi:DNA polymerase-3 subunit gamma/tau